MGVVGIGEKGGEVVGASEGEAFAHRHEHGGVVRSLPVSRDSKLQV